MLLADGSTRQWTMSVHVDGSAFRLELQATDGREWAAEGVDVYASLRVLRRQLEQDDIAIGCNGALPNARPSPFAARCGGWTVDLLHKWRPATAGDVVWTLGPVPPTEVATVEEQDARLESLSRASFSNILARCSPVWFVCFLVSRFERAVPRYLRGSGP